MTLLPLNHLPQKALNEIEIAKQFNKIKEGDLYYYSKEFGLIKIYKPKPLQSGIRLNKFNVANKIKQIDITVISPDNLNPRDFNPSDIRYFALKNMENIASKMVENKDMSYCYISTDSLPGYKILANTENYEYYQGDLIFTKEYEILFVDVLDIHESNYIKIDEKMDEKMGI